MLNAQHRPNLPRVPPEVRRRHWLPTLSGQAGRRGKQDRKNQKLTCAYG